jgi:hypothetical protein
MANERRPHVCPSGRLGSGPCKNGSGIHGSETVGSLTARSRQGRHRKRQAEWSPLHPSWLDGDTGVRRPQTKRSAALRGLASRRSPNEGRIPLLTFGVGGAGCRGTGEVESCESIPRSS